MFGVPMKRYFRSFAVVLGMAVIGQGCITSTAQAITYGSTVADLTKTAPYVVSIWTSPDNSQSDASFICTGSLIAPHIILTAAHCTTDAGSYFVKVGSKALADNTPYTSVSGVWHDPKYDPKTYQNDVGLLKINADFQNITFPSLANDQIGKNINTKTRLQLFGWGRDQSGALADLLRTTTIIPQDSVAAKSFGAVFKPGTMLAAGRKIQSQNLYSGGCSGDSGGPLTTNMNGITYLVGVTNWGAESCTKGTPTVFARVSSFQNSIRAGISSVETLAQVSDRTAPTYTTAPSITGNVIPGQTLTCSQGVWQNAVNVEISWLSPARIAGSTNPTVTVKPSDAGAQFRCRVIANSKNSSVTYNTPSKVRTPSDSLVANPVISGVQAGTQVKAGSIARCDGWAWKIPVDSDSVSWYSTSMNNPLTPVNGKLLGTGQEFTLTQDVIRSENGRFLTCQVTGVLGGFSSFGTSSILISAPEAPVINSISLNGYNLTNGSTFSCNFNATGNTGNALVEWGTPSGYSGFTPFGQTGTSIQITPSIIQLGSGKPIACRVTVSNAGGDTSKIATSLNTFEVAPAAPIVTATAYSWISGNSATCNASIPGNYASTFTYQWGISSNSTGASFDVSTLGSGSSLSLTSDILIKAAGKYLVCQATASNNAGTSVGFGRIAVPTSAAPSLPTISAPLLGTQSATVSDVTATFNIPTISGFSSSSMDLRMHLVGASCDNQQISSAPTSITCSGLSGSTSYSAYLTIAYLNNSQNSNRSLTTTFTSNQTVAPVLAPSALTANEATVGVIAYIGSGVSCPAANPVVAAEVNASTGVSYTKCWPQAAWSAWLAGGTTWSNYLATFTVTLPTPPAPIIGTQTAGSNSISVVIQIPNISNFNSSTMQATLVVNGSPTCSSVVVTPGSTQTCSTLTANTTYSAYISISPLSGTPTTTRSSSVSFTTSSLVANALTPSFSRVTSTSTGFTAQILNYDSSYSWAANITTGNAPSGSVSINSTGLISVTGLPASTTISISVTTNKSGFPQGIGSINAITLASPIDTISPTVVNNSLSMTGYAPIIPTTGAPATSIQIRFGATDNIGVANTSVRLINPGNVVVSTVSGSFIAGSVMSGVYQANLATASSGPANGDVYQIQAQASDAAGNFSTWVTIGSFTVNVAVPSAGPPVLSNGAISPGTLSAGQSITARYVFTSNPDISNCTETILDSGGNALLTIPGATLVSGNAFAGTESVQMTVPLSSVPGTYMVTAVCRNSAQLSNSSYTVGTFVIPQPAPTYPVSLVSSALLGSGIGGAGVIARWQGQFSNAFSVSLTATQGSTVLTAGYSPGPNGNTFVYRYSVYDPTNTTFLASLEMPSTLPRGSYTISWSVTNQSGITYNFGAGTFTLS